MSKQHSSKDKLNPRIGKLPTRIRKKSRSGSNSEPGSLSRLQKSAGNRAVQRLLAQRSAGDGSFDLDDETASRINRERSGGQALDPGFQEQMEGATGADLKDVRIHSTPEADELNRELGAKAFTSGKDVFFRDSSYDPHSSAGQELLAHELAHVIQQGRGAVGSSSGQMRVNPPDDAFEQEADSVSAGVTGPQAAAGVQLQEEEELVQAQEEEEEEALQLQEEQEEEELLQAQDMEEEEEAVQMQVEEEEEEEEAVQMQEEDEEELIQPRLNDRRRGGGSLI